MADENAAVETAAPEIDVDALSNEDFEKVKRGETIAPPKKEARQEPKAEAKQEAAAGEDDDGGDDEPADGKSTTVPHAKFHRANERAKAAEKQRDLAFQRLTELLQASQPPAQKEPEPEAPPEWVDAPIEAGQFWSKKVADLEQRIQQLSQSGQQERAASVVLQQSDADIIAFVNEKPEAKSAMDFLSRRGKEMLQEQGVTDPAQAKIAMDNWQIQLAQQARALGIRPARLLYMMAEENGWQPEQAPAPTAGENGEELPRDAAGRFAKAAAEMDKREATRKAAKSLNGTGGDPAVAKAITPEDIVNMSPEDFEAFKKKYGGADKSLARALGAM